MIQRSNPIASHMAVAFLHFFWSKCNSFSVLTPTHFPAIPSQAVANRVSPLHQLENIKQKEHLILRCSSVLAATYFPAIPSQAVANRVSPLHQLENKKAKGAPHFEMLLCVGSYLFSRTVASQVSSARQSLTSVFGMGTGGPSASMAPTSNLQNGCPLKTE